MSNKTGTTLLGAGLGGIGGAALGYAVAGPAGAVGLGLGGALLGGFIGSRNPTVIVDGQHVVIFMKHRDDQPKFEDLHMRNMTKAQFIPIDTFFDRFNKTREASDIRKCNMTGEYYYSIGVHEYALNPVTLETKEYLKNDPTPRCSLLPSVNGQSSLPPLSLSYRDRQPITMNNTLSPSRRRRATGLSLPSYSSQDISLSGALSPMFPTVSLPPL